MAVVLLTHHHLDHSEAARAFAERVGCGVRALDPAYRLGSEGLGEGDVVAVDDLEVRVVATPGHTADSLSFVLPSERAVLTGDTVLGRGTTVVAHPDGQLGAYLDSLDRLRALAEAHEIDAIWPGHGPVIDYALPVLDHYLAHRRERLDQVREALRGLHADARDGVPLDHDALPAPHRRDRVRRRRPRPLARRRALRPRPAGLPRPVDRVEPVTRKRGVEPALNRRRERSPMRPRAVVHSAIARGCTPTLIRRARSAAWTISALPYASRSPVAQPREPSGLTRQRGYGRCVSRPGCVRRVLHGVYLRARRRASRMQVKLAAAARVISPNAVACDRTAAWIWDVDAFSYGELDVVPPLETFVLRGRHRTDATETSGRRARPRRRDDWVEVDGVKVTDPAADGAGSRVQPEPAGRPWPRWTP